MNIVGICDNHDAGAVLICDGRIVAAVNEERLNRKKLYRGFPALSILKVLELGNVEPCQVDLVAIASSMTPCILMRCMRKWQGAQQKRGQFSYLLNLYTIYQCVAHVIPLLQKIEARLSIWCIRRELSALGIHAKTVVVEHHFAHAYAGFVAAGFDTALICTVDGLGDGVSVTISVGDRTHGVRQIYEQGGFSAITFYYSRITEFLGFKAIKDEGKITGLAAHGNPDVAMKYAKKQLRFTGKGFNYHNCIQKQHKGGGIYKRLKDQHISREDIAAAFQKNIEEELEKFILYWLNRTGMKKIILSGGLFANVKINQMIAHLPAVSNIHVFPHMGDGGLAMGAALSACNSKPYRITSLFLGPEYCDEDIVEALHAHNVRYTYVEHIERRIAELLACGKVVARYWGRMEYGPRALGNRSILYQPTDQGVNKWLNQKLQRTEFMPFAPATLAEYFQECFMGSETAVETARFMNVSFRSSEYFRQTCPGVVHVDGTVRPQYVDKKDNPKFHLIINEYHNLTGLPCVVNTSFNMHEEPIVCTPTEAIQAFIRAELDYLAVGHYLVSRECLKGVEVDG